VAAGLAVVVAVLDAVGAASFALIAVLVARLVRLLGTGRWEAPLGFALLSVGDLLGVVAAVAAGPRASLAAYTGTSSFSLAGLLLLALPQRGAAAVASLLLVPASIDAAAAVAAAAASLRFRRAARVLVALLSLGHLARSLAVMVAGSEPWWGLLLAAGEAVRSSSAALLAGYYLAEAVRPGGRG